MSAAPNYKKDIFLLCCIQLILVILFVIFGRYGQEYDLGRYGMFQDVHIMIFIGFGFLMTFLKRYGYSSVGFNFLLASVIIQWAILCTGFYNLTEDNKILITMESLYGADIAAAAVLISMGAVLGQTSYLQLIIMGIIEIAVFSANSYLGLSVFKAVDAGASIFVHIFGAYFGLAVSYVINKSKTSTSEQQNDLEGASYTSDLFAMIGTVFLWICWPSFNAIELDGDEKHRAVINTYLSLASCCVTAFIVSQVLSHEHKFDMVHVQNSTLAGGVAVGTCANLMIEPYGAIIVGVLAGALSVYGYVKLTPLIEKFTGIHDTCGVHNLHGMPGVLAGLAGCLMAGIATEQMYPNNALYEIYPERANNTQPIAGLEMGRSAGQQAGFQIVAVIVTLLIAVVAGLITGGLLRFMALEDQRKFDDLPMWTLPENEEEKTTKSARNPEVANFDNLAFDDMVNGNGK